MTFTDSDDQNTQPELPPDGQTLQESAPVASAGPPQPDTEQMQKLSRWVAADNIADELSDELLLTIGQRVKDEYQIDVDSRTDWVTKTEKAMDFAMQVAEEKTYPWPKASNVIFPLMTTSAIQFAARAYPAIIAGRDVAKGIVIGTDDGTPALAKNGQPIIDPGGQPRWQMPPGGKQERANRIGEHMSWQLLEEMPEWEGETDKLLHILPIVGCVFRKSYFDPGQGRNFSVLVSALNVVINYHAKSLDSTPRATEKITLYPIEIEEAERAGTFTKIDYTPEGEQPEGASAEDKDAPKLFLEQHRYWDLDGDDYPEPYVVTIHAETSRVVRIKARYDEDGVQFSGKTHKIARIEPVQYYTQYDFLPNPAGIYGIGFGQLLMPINAAANTSLNQLIDSGHLANTGGGFIGRGLSMNAGSIRFSPGEYKMVNVAGSAVKDNIVPMQFPGPSMVLFQLLELLIDAGKDVAAVKDVLTGEQDQHNVPATTTMALIEQGLKVFTAIYKRVHRALKLELKKLYRLNSIYLPVESAYRRGDTWKMIQKDDYTQAAGVEPISDPNMVSDMQIMANANFLMTFANDPMCDGMEIRSRVLKAGKVPHVERILRPPPPNPEFVHKAMELQIKAERDKAAELKDLAQAILFFAQADALVGDAHLAWVNSQLASWQSQWEAHAAGGAPGPDGAPNGMQQPPPPMGGAPGPGAHPLTGGM